MIIHCDTTRFIYEVLENQEYKFLFEDLIVVDAGCNVGTFSIWIEPFAKIVHAIDVAPRNIENLNKTIKDNGFTHIKTYCLALAGRDGPRWISDLGGIAGDGGFQMRDIPNEGLEADGYSMTSFMKKAGLTRIDVLKLDVEGSEAEILEATDFPADKISTIIGEFHNGISVQKRLEDLGYQYFEHGGGHFVARR